jgi:p-aminobenzoyl-glutamate transporter AbgT
MKSKRERTTNRRIWFLILISLVIVELGWWIAEEVFCDPKVHINSRGAKEVTPNNSFFCRLSR